MTQVHTPLTRPFPKLYRHGPYRHTCLHTQHVCLIRKIYPHRILCENPYVWVAVSLTHQHGPAQSSSMRVLENWLVAKWVPRELTRPWSSNHQRLSALIAICVSSGYRDICGQLAQPVMPNVQIPNHANV